MNPERIFTISGLRWAAALANRGRLLRHEILATGKMHLKRLVDITDSLAITAHEVPVAHALQPALASAEAFLASWALAGLNRATQISHRLLLLSLDASELLQLVSAFLVSPKCCLFFSATRVRRLQLHWAENRGFADAGRAGLGALLGLLGVGFELVQRMAHDRGCLGEDGVIELWNTRVGSGERHDLLSVEWPQAGILERGADRVRREALLFGLVRPVQEGKGAIVGDVPAKTLNRRRNLVHSRLEAGERV